MFEELPTPTLLLDRDRVERNIERMQAICDAHDVELWPHVKTHKLVEVARMQLAAGASGLTCAKLGEAEALLPSGVRSLFLANSVVDPLQAPRLRALADQLDELIVACTSEAQATALDAVLARADLQLPVMMAVDMGLGREGARSLDGAVRLAEHIGRLPHLELRGLYAHEGQAYGVPHAEVPSLIHEIYERLMNLRDCVDPSLPVWPGCSVTAAKMATLPGVDAVRPGAYVFGDLSLTVLHPAMDWEDVAVTVLATVADRPEPGLALLDAGSKTLSSDKTPAGIAGSLQDRRDIHVTRCSEEHGWTSGAHVNDLRIGERVRIVPAHICPVINLSDEVTVISGDRVVNTWRVAARGKVQ